MLFDDKNFDFSPHVRGVRSFQHSEYVEPQKGWMKLNSNESFYPPSPKVIKAIQDVLQQGGDVLRLYPQPRSLNLRDALAKKYGLNPSQVILGNGCEELFNIIIRSFCNQEKKITIYQPSYPLHFFLANIQGIQCDFLDLQEDLDLHPERLKENKSSLLFITTPHWPTGYAFSLNQIRSLLNVFDGLLVLDEAYTGFATQDALDLLKDYSNLIIVRTFSKKYALAGLRVAYMLGRENVMNVLSKMHGPYSLGVLQQVGALAALEDQSYYQSKIEQLCQIRTQALSFFKEIGWRVYDSQANFILTQPLDNHGRSSIHLAKDLYHYLKKNKILIRHFDEHPLTASYIRISIGSWAQMSILFNTIRSYLSSEV